MDFPILQGRQLLWLPVCFAHYAPSENGSTLKENSFIPFKVDLFSEGRQNSFNKMASPVSESESVPHNVEVKQGPIVQRVVSLTSSLRVISLTVLADSIYNILIFFSAKNFSIFVYHSM